MKSEKISQKIATKLILENIESNLKIMEMKEDDTLVHLYIEILLNFIKEISQENDNCFSLETIENVNF